MMAGPSVSMDGLGDLFGALEQLDVETQPKVLAACARVAFAPVLQAARELVAERTGTLRKSLKIVVTRPKRGTVDASAGITAGKATLTGEEAAEGGIVATGASVSSGGALRVKVDAFWWKFVERGIPSRGIAARPFLRPALYRHGAECVGIFRDVLGKRVAAALRRQARNTRRAALADVLGGRFSGGGA